MKWLLLFLFALPAAAQTTCSTSNPCVSVQVTTTVPSNVGNSTASLYACMGATSGCNATTLAAFLASPSTPSQWRNLGTFAQKATTVSYNDPEPYGALMNYAASNTPSGGAAGPVSAIYVFQVPAAPQTAPQVGSSASVITSGSAGPQ